MTDFLNIMISRAVVTLTAAQVKALHTTPITLVAARGAGIVLVPHRVILASTFVSAAYTGANNLEFRYTNGSGAKAVGDIAAATLNFSSGTQYSVAPPLTTEYVPVANAALVVAVPVANPAVGDSPVTFAVFYSAVKIP